MALMGGLESPGRRPELVECDSAVPAIDVQQSGSTPTLFCVACVCVWTPEQATIKKLPAVSAGPEAPILLTTCNAQRHSPSTLPLTTYHVLHQHGKPGHNAKVADAPQHSHQHKIPQQRPPDCILDKAPQLGPPWRVAGCLCLLWAAVHLRGTVWGRLV